MKVRLSFLCCYCLLLANYSLYAQNPDNISADFELLKSERSILLSKERYTEADLRAMLKLGLWQQAKAAATSHPIIQAELAFLEHHFTECENLLQPLLSSGSIPAQVLNIKLHIASWELSDAFTLAKRLETDNIAEGKYWQGRIFVLEKQYDEGLEMAKALQASHPEMAAAYLLESDVYFWNQKPSLAEAPLKKSLSLDPFNADARFNYGYAIWRRVDASQLKDMAAQWEMALTINPLHYVTHWHWGNGHTHLTYADYKSDDDEAVQILLQEADRLIEGNQLEVAVEKAKAVQRQYPESVLPAMLEASTYYMAFNSDIENRLDSAREKFSLILKKKPHYGPAHNGLAATIKQQQISYLAAYDSLQSIVENAEIADPENFEHVFPDINYYPGRQVRNMVRAQLYESTVYFPFLAKQNLTFKLPPLHRDLATAMGSNYFRQATTFDNRQWMDIRGVGSGATGIEYIIRGAFLERNVTLHEYVHLYHGRVFTDEENRRVRALYYNAMEQDRTLDYYSSNNESEYLAQTYPAYFETVKVHPLNHKSINTRGDLMQKDPELYDFLDSLVSRQKQYLAGDSTVMQSNWAQVYLNLAAQEEDAKKQLSYIDSAFMHDARYKPAFIAKSMTKLKQERHSEALSIIEQAIAIDSTYAPYFLQKARILEAAAIFHQEENFTAQLKAYQKSIELERDYAEIARNYIQFREFYLRHAMPLEAIALAELYQREGATVSTYLRDRRDEATAFAAYHRALLGESSAIDQLKRLSEHKPQHYEIRRMHVEALLKDNQYEAALKNISEVQKIINAAGGAYPVFDLMQDIAQHGLEHVDAGTTKQQNFLTNNLSSSDYPMAISYFIAIGNTEEAASLIKKMNTTYAYDKAMTAYLHGLWAMKAGDMKAATTAFDDCLEINAYHIDCIEAYMKLARMQGNTRKERRLANQKAEILENLQSLHY